MTELPLSSRKRGAIPVYPLHSGGSEDLPAALTPAQRKWVAANGFAGGNGSVCLVPDEHGGMACALFRRGKEASPLEFGLLARKLPAADWRLETASDDAYLAHLGFLLGAYRFDRFVDSGTDGPRLLPAAGIDADRLVREAEATYLARDLINRPANDLGPTQLEGEIRALAKSHGARVRSIRGDELLARNFPMIHAVGRASNDAPRLLDMNWGSSNDPKVTLVGKGVCFDTGGLNLKPGNSMALMKKDMGGAASVLALASLIMGAGLPVRLRVLVAIVENAVSGNAFRPGDILTSRKGITVEIGDTDAEGRLILADALDLADNESPEILIDMATLTGAARVALGPDLPAMFCDDDDFAHDVGETGRRLQDPVWRMPLWPGYRSSLSSSVADINHVWKSPFAGSITAALFLQRFVEKSKCWAHFDVYGWVPARKPWAPVGGEAFCIRTLFDVLAARFPVR